MDRVSDQAADTPAAAISSDAAACGMSVRRTTADHGITITHDRDRLDEAPTPLFHAACLCGWRSGWQETRANGNAAGEHHTTEQRPGEPIGMRYPIRGVDGPDIDLVVTPDQRHPYAGACPPWCVDGGGTRPPEVARGLLALVAEVRAVSL